MPILDPILPLNCPTCGQPLRYLGPMPKFEMQCYVCAVDGRMFLRPDGSVSPQQGVEGWYTGPFDEEGYQEALDTLRKLTSQE
jgi:hypothetical protein